VENVVAVPTLLIAEDTRRLLLAALIAECAYLWEWCAYL